jgi:hypothetical protein
LRGVHLGGAGSGWWPWVLVVDKLVVLVDNVVVDDRMVDDVMMEVYHAIGGEVANSATCGGLKRKSREAESIFLVANDWQAAAIRARGMIAYTPPEVAILRDLYAGVRPEVWAERLRLIHETKKRFQGRLEA